MPIAFTAVRADGPKVARTSTLNWGCGALGVLAAAAVHCGPAAAQTPATKAPPRSLSLPAPVPMPQQPPTPTAQQRLAYDAAFKATLDKPSDPDTLARFAELAVQVGDIEGAISALERLLLIEGDQPEVKLELGVLYYRLGSKEAAITYLEAARASPDATAETRARADALLKAATP